MTDPTPLPEQDTPEQDPTPLPGGITPNGWPYVTPDDHPMQYPATSQALAERLEASPRITGGTATVNGESQWITFPPGMFTVPPAIVANNGNMQFQPQLVIGVQEITTTGCRATAYGATGATIWQLVWIAVGT